MSGPISQSPFGPAVGEPRAPVRGLLLGLFRMWFDDSDIRERRIPFAGHEPPHPRGRDDN